MTAPDVNPSLGLDDLRLPAVSTCTIDAGHLARVAATVDAAVPGTGSPLPVPWHWAWFTPTTPTRGLGADGHPVVTGPLVARYPRRMWAAGRIAVEEPLTIGEPATRHSRVAGARTTTGRSGELLVVELEHIYEQAGRPRLVEQQTLIYRSAASTSTSSPSASPPAPAVAVGAWQERRVIDPTLLFRFSAVTFNAHRIHYDEPYAREVEEYPGLVVHAPLSAWLLIEAGRRHAGGALRSVAFTVSAPLFAGHDVTLAGQVDGDRMSSWITDHDGRRTTEMTTELS